jgi:hypothetical protein
MRRRNPSLALCLLLVLSGAAQAAFKFTAWADNRPSLGSTTQANFHWVVLEMNRILCPPADPSQWPLFHIVPGDYDYTSQTTGELNSYSDFSTWYYAPGNHDDNIGSSSNSSMDHENARFIFLNEYVCPAGIDDNSAGRVCPHILSWLDGQLTNAPPFVFVVGHEPAFPQNRHVGDSLDYYPADRDAFWELINARGVYAYLCGHTHYYSTYSDGTGPTVQIDLGNAGNPGEPEQTFVLFEVTDSGVNWQTYQGLRDQPFDGGSQGTQATNPSPANGADNVPLDAVLSWTAGSGAQSHNVYLSTVPGDLGQAGALIYAGTNSSCPASGLASGVMHYWRVDEVQSGGGVVTGATWSFTTRSPLPLTVSHVTAETTASGSVTGGLSALQNRDNAYEALTEALNVQNKNGYSVLEHVWRFDNVPAGANVELRVEAYQTASSDGDDFQLSYSTDGLTYTSLLTVSRTWDNDSEQICPLPSNLQGTIWIKATDTDHTRKNQLLDTLYVDCLYLVSADEAIPEVVVPDESGNQPPLANAGPDQTVAADSGGSATVTLDGSASLDPDGSIVSYSWVTGATTLTGPNPSHDFPVGTHVVTLTVTDNGGASATDTVTITVSGVEGTMHVADLDGVASGKGNSSQWSAQVTVKVVNGSGTDSPVPGATVTGAWSGPVSVNSTGVTDSSGTVTLASGALKTGTSVTFTVTSVTHATLVYAPAANADPDGDSNGTVIVISKP